MAIAHIRQHKEHEKGKRHIRELNEERHEHAGRGTEQWDDSEKDERERKRGPCEEAHVNVTLA